MKKKTKIILIVSIIAIIFLIVGLFIGNMKKDKKKTQQVMEIILKESKEFENNVLSFFVYF